MKKKKKREKKSSGNGQSGELKKVHESISIWALPLFLRESDHWSFPPNGLLTCAELTSSAGERERKGGEEGRIYILVFVPFLERGDGPPVKSRRGRGRGDCSAAHFLNERRGRHRKRERGGEELSLVWDPTASRNAWEARVHVSDRPTS